MPEAVPTGTWVDGSWDKVPDAGWLHQQFIVSQSGGQESEVKLWAGLVPSGGWEGQSAPGLS